MKRFDWHKWDEESDLEKAVMLRRAPSGGYGNKFKGGQFIPAADWIRERDIAKASITGIVEDFGKQMQYVRGVWEATAALGDNAPKSLPTRGHSRWMMKKLIRQTYEAAFTAGKRSGGNLFAITDADRKAIQKTRYDEFKYLEKFMADMDRGGGVMDYEKRMDYYAKAARELYWLGFVRADMDPSREIDWRLGQAEHCQTCLDAASGSPYTAKEFWDKLASKGILPQSGKLDCLGYKCQCHLEDTRPETDALKSTRKPKLRLVG